MVKTFENGIYPLTLVIAVDAKPEDICNNYCIYNDDNIPMTISIPLYKKIFEGKEAITFEGMHIKKRNKCMISIFSTFDSRLDICVGTMAHEACHIADKICDNYNIKYGTFENGEAHAYICGWAANCISTAVKDLLNKKK